MKHNVQINQIVIIHTDGQPWPSDGSVWIVVVVDGPRLKLSSNLEGGLLFAEVVGKGSGEADYTVENMHSGERYGLELTDA